MQKYLVMFDSHVYQFVHHLAQYEIEAENDEQALIWAKNKLPDFAERDNAAIGSIKPIMTGGKYEGNK